MYIYIHTYIHIYIPKSPSRTMNFLKQVSKTSKEEVFLKPK